MYVMTSELFSDDKSPTLFERLNTGEIDSQSDVVGDTDLSNSSSKGDLLVFSSFKVSLDERVFILGVLVCFRLGGALIPFGGIMASLVMLGSLRVSISKVSKFH